MNLHLEGKKVFISGSTKGIGFETARLFLEKGAKVIINGRTKKGVETALNSLNSDNVSGLVADFIDHSEVKNLIDQIPNDIDILVNNVGIFRGKEFKDETVELPLYPPQKEGSKAIAKQIVRSVGVHLI